MSAVIASLSTLDWMPLVAPPGTTVTIRHYQETDTELARTMDELGDYDTYDVITLWVRLPERAVFSTIPQPPSLQGVTVDIQPWIMAVTTAGVIVPIYPNGGPELNVSI